MTRIIHRAALAAALCIFTLSTLAALDAAPANAGPRTAKVRIAKAKPAAPAVEGKLNLNTADEAQLRMLPGVGDTKAARIVEWRKKHGKFRRIKDLRRVKGFGKKTVQKLEPYLTLQGPTTLRKRQ